jgi:hypothetical protein
MEAMRNVPLDDTTGELQRLQAQYNANNEKLKEFDASLGNHQRNVGNYGDSLKGMGGQLSGLPGPIGNASKAFTTLNTVLKANPLLLVVAAVAALIAALSKLQPVVDFVSKQFQILSNVTQFFVDKVGGFLGIIEKTDITLGETIRKTAELADAEVRLRDAKREQIVSLAKQDEIISELRLKAADQTLSEEERLKILRQIEDEEEIALNKRLDTAAEELRIAKEQARINYSNADVLNTLAEKEAAMSKIKEESNNFLVRITQRRTGLEKQALEDAKRGEEELAAKRKQAADEQQRKIEQVAVQAKKLRDEVELLDKDQFEVQRILAERQFQENVKLLKQGTDAYNDALRIRDAAFKKIEADQQRIKDENDKKEIERAQQQAQKLLAIDVLRNQTLNDIALSKLEEQGNLVLAEEMRKQIRIQELTELFQSYGLDAYQAGLRAEEQATLESLSKIEAARKQQADNEDKNRQKQLKLEKDAQQAKINMYAGAADSILAIGESLFGKNKAIAVAGALLDTFRAANGVMADTKGPLWTRLLSAAAIVAQGLANVKKIVSTKPGGGNAGGGGGMAAPRPAMSTMAVSPAGNIVSPDFARGQLAGQVATDATSPGMQLRPVQVSANVDRRGLAIAVREGERSIRTQQFDFK